MALRRMTEMKENPSIIDESGTATTRMVTKDDGTKVPFSEEHLRNSLSIQLEGLNRDLLNVDIILHKVSSGLYNGKHIISIVPPFNFTSSTRCDDQGDH